jgi:beta-phosphoglucomutase-like phosphatase (HAD superfamily)
VTTPPALPLAVLLDLDGTLVDTVPQRVASWLAAFDDEGITATAAELGPLMGGDGRWVVRRIAERRGLVLDEDAQERLDRASGEWFGRQHDDRVATAGAQDLLLALDAARVPWAIATSSRPEQTGASVAALDLARPPRIVDSSHVRHAKPAPDLLLAGASQLGVPPADVWYVGDSRWDMLAAVSAGMVPVAVLTGATGADDLRDAGADIVVPTLAELLPLLRDAGLGD